MQRSIIFLTVIILCLAACTPALPESATPTVHTTQTAVTDQLNLFATQTQSVAAASTATAQQDASQPSVPVFTPSLLPDVTLAFESVGPFRQVSSQEALILGKVLGLQAVEDGFLLFSEGGISYFKDDQWTGYLTQFIGYPVGVDESGRAWVVEADGSRIYRSKEQVTNHQAPSDETEAWIMFEAEAGWLPVPNSIGSPVKFGLTTDNRGSMWVSTQKDVRLFDGTWQVYVSLSMGMPLPAGDYVSEFSLYPIHSSGEVYAGRCDWGNSGPAGGGGWRVFDGRTWSEADPALSNGCVNVFAQGDSGNVFIAQDASLWLYDTELAALEQVPLPAPPQQYRFGYFTGLTVGPDNSLWVLLALCSTEGCFGGEVLYRLEDGVWHQVGELSPAPGQQLLFDKNGTAWLLSAGSIYKIVEDTFQPVPGLLVQAATVDDAGALWLLAQASGPPTLWTLQ
jgi:hypothetical protein